MGGFFFLIVFLMGYSIFKIGKFILFGPPKNESKIKSDKTQSSYRQNDRRQESEQSSQNRKKIFSKDEGEYVDYEEVK
jgi:hypothetical protein